MRGILVELLITDKHMDWLFILYEYIGLDQLVLCTVEVVLNIASTRSPIPLLLGSVGPKCWAQQFFSPNSWEHFVGPKSFGPTKEVKVYWLPQTKINKHMDATKCIIIISPASQ